MPDAGEAGTQSDDDGWDTSNELPAGAQGEAQRSGDETQQPGGGTETADAGGGRPGGPGDSELERALEDFDGQILAERAEILAKANRRAGEVPEAELPGGEPEESDSGSSSGGGASPGDATGAAGGTSAPPPPRPVPTAGPVPPDVPDAKDDDVVARQLREAAMAETDPELREALWEEYRRYKDGK